MEERSVVMEQREITIDLPVKNRVENKTKKEFFNKIQHHIEKYRKNFILFRRDIFRLIIFNVLGFFWASGEVLHLFNPLGLAYLSLFFGENIFFYTVLCSVTFGSFYMPPLKIGAMFSSALAIELTLGKDLKYSDKGKKALLAGFSMALASVFYAVASGGLTFYYVVAFVETILVITISYIAQKGMAIFRSKDDNFVLTKEEILGFLFLFSGAFVGVSNVDIPILEQGLLSFMCSYFIIISAKSEGMSGGSCAGLILGFLLYLCGGVNSEIFALFGIAGLLTGAIKDLGKIPMSGVNIALPLLLILYQDRDLFTEMWLQGWILGSLTFCLTPNKILALFHGQAFNQENSRNVYIKKKRLLEQKLKDFSKAFYALGKTFKPNMIKEEKKDVVKMVDRIAENTCNNCGDRKSVV